MSAHRSHYRIEAGPVERGSFATHGGGVQP
jgi:hypothetical protein